MKTLPIKKHITLLKRLPETRFSSKIDLQRANWIVFSNYLSPSHFEDIDFFTGYYNAVVATWKVGQYEVALMSGELTKEHETILQALSLDYASLTDVPDLSKPGLVVMDMDSTAIQIECIDEIAKLAGVGEQVSEVTERAMQGELDFEQSLRQRVGALKDANESILESVRSELPMMPDLQEFVASLQALGWKTAIASGGFTYFSDYLKETLNLDHAQSNTLEIVNGKLTGKVLGDIVSAQTKADILRQLAEEYEIEPENTVAVGDGANDLVMMDAAGLGVAYHAKPKVEQQAQTAVRYSGLGGVLCILSASLIKQQKIAW
ncbi:phosphoserine phosphatase [Vibrio nigripulchritudo SFn27]|uniref:Phosphoserine phosphatase n=1 Tax=Vibrio nigripulchritudo TaxID=28173 RepID=U4KD14_9VIBR|nr:phosphoserine phosphatase [Vibrio nigripulchritudo]CCN83159.1 phosphoserine phosphatase [Vibrio nigripulchritudo BLFn1]CCN86237.1 phosphoserine phosphatase [Vibrio nigripulchritudo SFn27]CCN92797.1 phosphoserine phosphatase [Vibrio nigripulchritudo ENn2]CCO42767.1 phosphoserine phosphatase [Vibrio nigripulchritudo SFn135]CCO52633.1 phosphoserine phosphatase [Vibrio nigripulchritudo Wn13]